MRKPTSTATRSTPPAALSFRSALAIHKPSSSGRHPPLGGGRILARFPFSKYLSTISRPSAPSTIIPEEPTMMTISDICLRRQLGQPGTTCALRADKSREGHGRWKSTRMARMPRRGLEGLGGGKESTLKSVKTASWTGTLGERMGGDNLDNSGQLFARCAA